MRIALLTYAFPPDSEYGIPRYVYELADGLGKLKHEVEVFSGCEDAERSRESNKHFNVSWVPLPKGYSRHLPVYDQLKLSFLIRKKLLSLHKERPFDIVEFPNHPKLAGYCSVTLGLPEPTPAFVIRLSSPGQEFPKPGITPWRLSEIFEKHQTRKVSGIIGNTVGNLRKCEAVYNLDPGIIRTVILHGLPGGPEPKLHFNETCQNVAFFLGRIEPRKGFDTLASAWEFVIKKIPSAKLVVAGQDQPWKGGSSFLKHCLSGLSSETLDRIEYVGHVDPATKEHLLSTCDVFAAPSRYESFGLIFLEAMRYGKPVVSCETGGIPDVVSNGKTGLLVEPEDVRGLANAIIHLFSSNEVRRAMGIQAIQKLEDQYYQERVALESAKFYKLVKSA